MTATGGGNGNDGSDDGSDDEVARARTRQWMAARPEVPDAGVAFHRTPKRRGRGLAIRVAWTHVVQELRENRWRTIHNGSEADCARTLDLVQRHFPAKQHRMVTLLEADADDRKKAWSVNDADHLPDGTRVLLARAPAAIHPSLGKAHVAFGIAGDDHQHRYGFVRSRNRYGNYMVEIESAEIHKLLVCVTRDDIIFPIPENVIPMDFSRRRSR